MKRTWWGNLLVGVMVVGIAGECGAEEAAAAPAAEEVRKGPVLEWVKGVDRERWESFLVDTMSALKERAEDPEGKAETRKAMEEGAKTADEVIARLVGVAESMEKTARSPEFKAMMERLGKDVGSAAESLKEVDYSGVNKMLEALTREVVEPMEVVAEKFEKHFGAEGKAGGESVSEGEVESEAPVAVEIEVEGD